MDEDCDTVLVIDLDDDKEEVQDDGSNTDEEMRPIIDNKYMANENKNVEHHYNAEYRVTSKRLNQNNDHNSDDEYIQVIDDDEDYKHSVQTLIHTANEDRREFFKNKQLNNAINEGLNDYPLRKRDNQVYNSNLIDGDSRDRLQDQQKLIMGRDAINMGVTRDRLVRNVKQNRRSVRTTYEPGIYESRYVMGNILHPIHEERTRPLRSDAYMRNMPNIPYSLETLPRAYRQLNTNRPEVALSIEDYHAYMNRYIYSHAYSPNINMGNDFYPNDSLDRNTYIHVQRPEILSTDGCMHSGMTKDIYDMRRTEDLLSIDEYRRVEMNRHPYFYTHRPEDVRLHDYRHSARERDAYSYAHRLDETSNYNEYRNAINNRFIYGNYRPVDALDDHWQTKFSRHAYRPEKILSIEDYERMIRNCHVHNNAYKPPVAFSLDPYRTVELDNIYRPNLVNMDTYTEPMLIRNAYNPETAGIYGCRPEMNVYRSEIDDVYRNDEATLNLSCKKETINVATNRSREENIDVSKLRSKLSTEAQVPLNMDKTPQKFGNPNVPYTTEHKYKKSNTTLDHTTVPSVNKSEAEHVEVTIPGVAVRTKIPDTVILSTKNIYHKNKSAQSGVLATSQTIHEHRQNIKTTAEELKSYGTTLSINAGKCKVIHEVSKKHEEQTVDLEKKGREANIVEKDSKVRFLVVFFTRVKDLVKETFPEFSKSLEKEIENLGEWTNSGRLKTDIQYICPLYCSVSTYSLPQFDDTDDDNKIEKHVNRSKICDVCSCIQNCYKLYKKKCFNLISTKTDEKQPNVVIKGDGRGCHTPIDGLRVQSVICIRKGTDCEENNSNEDVQKDPLGINIESRISDKDMHGVNFNDMVIDDHPLADLNEKNLLDSLSVLNFNIPSKNTANGISSNNNIQDRIEFDNPIQMTFNDDEEMFIEGEDRVDKDNYPRDEDEANLILSLSVNEITNADIIASKLTDKISKKPDTVFTCHICTCIFTYFTSFVSHMQKEHNLNGIEEDIPDEYIARKCPFCGIYSKQKYHNDHVKRSHPEIFTHKGEHSEIQLIKVNKRSKFKKRKFIFTCLVCYKNLKSSEVKRHREKEHKGLKVAKMFTKKLSNMD